MTKEFTPKNIVVYADDDEEDLQLVSDAFSEYSENIDLLTFSDGSQVLKYLKSLLQTDPIPCLIILDINMPKITGKEVLVQLRRIERFNTVPAILFTTSSQPVDKEFAAKNNAGFITKPINFHQMNYIAEQFMEFCSDEVKKNIKRIL